jgi:hypothetical protein
LISTVAFTAIKLYLQDHRDPDVLDVKSLQRPIAGLSLAFKLRTLGTSDDAIRYILSLRDSALLHISNADITAIRDAATKYVNQFNTLTTDQRNSFGEFSTGLSAFISFQEFLKDTEGITLDSTLPDTQIAVRDLFSNINYFRQSTATVIHQDFLLFTVNKDLLWQLRRVGNIVSRVEGDLHSDTTNDLDTLTTLLVGRRPTEQRPTSFFTNFEPTTSFFKPDS